MRAGVIHYPEVRSIFGRVLQADALFRLSVKARPRITRFLFRGSPIRPQLLQRDRGKGIGQRLEIGGDAAEAR